LIICNFSNQLAAGPKNISLNFIKQSFASKADNKFIFIVPKLSEYEQFTNSVNIKLIFVDVGGNVLSKIIKTIRINWFIMPRLYKRVKPRAILAFGNFLLGSFPDANKVVLLHHPYIVDDGLYSKLKGISLFSEMLKRRAFKSTIKNVDKVVVQSEYMKKSLIRKYPNFEDKLELIFNPISENFVKTKRVNESLQKSNYLTRKKTFQIIYVSRFYPHKNHEFIIKLAKLIKERSLPIELLVTINNNLPGAENFLNQLSTFDLAVINIGEISQVLLCKYYQECDLAIFPSNAETFGNPLIEAMLFSLPVIAPNKDYAKAILGLSGIFYNDDDEVECLELIQYTIKSKTVYEKSSDESYQRSTIFPDSSSWFEQYYSILK